jgi:tetratricopeptide (TPR) repeat protein
LVDFFSLVGKRLGNKLTLTTIIQDITGIARKSLEGAALSTFSIVERMSWAEHRSTTVEEDKAYCLLGIFGVAMPLIYGEGEGSALRRLHEEIHKLYKGADFEQYNIGLNLSTFPKAAHFVARENELAEMHKLLYGRPTRSIVVLHGLGGIGKTQLAIAYTQRHKEKYTAVFWLNANDEDSLRLSFRNIAKQVQEETPSTGTLANVDLDDLDQVMKAVKAWLRSQKNTHWLMIYDNYDNPKIPGNPGDFAVDIRSFLPESDHGSIIITTRSSQVTQGRRIHVQRLLSIHESLSILSNTSERKSIENDPAAIELVNELDGLPLALSTAGAYLEHVTMGFSEYLQLYKASWLKLQTTTPQLASYEDRSLYTTWQITFDGIEQQNPASAKLLKLWAYFDKQDLWFKLLRSGLPKEQDWIQEVTEDELSFNEAMRLLCNYGLVDANLSSRQLPGSNGYSVHSCVHLWSISVLNKEWDDGLARPTASCVAASVPDAPEMNWWLIQRRLLPHAGRLEHFIVTGKADYRGSHWLFHNLGNLYMEQGKLQEAESMYTWALQGKEESFGRKHAFTLTTVNSLGILYRNQGKHAQAEAMYKRAWQGYEEALGPKSICTLDSVFNLGITYNDQGKLAGAETLYNIALQGYAETLGPTHTFTLEATAYLGTLYMSQGRLADAEAMLARALQGYEASIGPSLSTLNLPALYTIHGLADLFMKTHRVDLAREMYARVWYGYSTIFGPASDECAEMDRLLRPSFQRISAETEFPRYLPPAPLAIEYTSAEATCRSPYLTAVEGNFAQDPCLQPGDCHHPPLAPRAIQYRMAEAGSPNLTAVESKSSQAIPLGPETSQHPPLERIMPETKSRLRKLLRKLRV